MVRQICIRMHQNGMTYREIERLTGVSHNTVIGWVRELDTAEAIAIEINLVEKVEEP